MMDSFYQEPLDAMDLVVDEVEYVLAYTAP